MIDREDEELKKSVETQLTLAHNAEATRNALALLFPPIERVIKTYVPTDHDVNLRKANRRISQKDFAQAYFSLNPDPASWGRSEFERLIADGPEAAFATLRRRNETLPPIEQARLRRLLLELLDAAFSSTVEITQNWLDQLLAESAELLRHKDSSAKFLFTFDNEDRLRWLIVSGIDKLPVARRVELLKNAIRRASDLTVLSIVVRDIVGDSNPEGSRERGTQKANLGNDSDTIRHQLLGRVKSLSTKPSFWGQARPARLLWFWWGCDRQSEVQEFTRRAMRTKAGLLGLLDASIGVVTSSSEGTFERVDKASWSKIVDIDALTEKARRLEKDTPDQHERNAANRFLKAVERDTGF
jgi:hypothetical protein